MNIVHPPYATSAFWLSQIDSTKVRVPAWEPLSDLHPCDFQSSMLKGCLPSDDESRSFYAIARRCKIRQIYYAMIAEFDAMVGKYMDAVKQAGVWDNTVWIVTSDHGDMNMLKQQHYKMVPYDASASVPMVIFDGRLPRGGQSLLGGFFRLLLLLLLALDGRELGGKPLRRGAGSGGCRDLARG